LLKTYGVHNNMREFHALTIKNKESNQLFVFNISKFQDMIHIHQIWIITQINGGEVKSIIDLDKLATSMDGKIGINDEQLTEVLNVFGEVLPADVKNQIQNEIKTENILDEMEDLAIKSFSDVMIKASEQANLMFPTLSMEELAIQYESNRSK